MNCPCTSKKSYKECCQPFHQGEIPKNAVDLMRARFSAYALGLEDFIIETTHPTHPDFSESRELKKEQIRAFCNHTQFLKLEIIKEQQFSQVAFVTFHATLVARGQDVSFTEKSRFEKYEGKWLYQKAVTYRQNKHASSPKQSTESDLKPL